MKKLLLLFLPALLASPAFGQPIEGWRPSSVYWDSLDLYHRGELIGSLHQDGRWMPAGTNTALDLGREFEGKGLMAGKTTKTGMQITRKPLAGDDGTGNFGNNWNPQRGESFSINGIETSKTNALRAIGAPDSKIPDDGKLLRLTIISNDPADRAQVLADLETSKELAAFKGKLVVRALDPAGWQAQGMGYVASGKPTIYIQSPEGKVLHRQDDYGDGPAGLAGALRKIDPNYDPRRDPDLRKGSSPSPGGPDDVNWPVVSVAGLLTILGAGRLFRG